jgi:hypothetical protein
MLKVESRIQEANLWIDSPTIEQVNSMYLAVAEKLFPREDNARPISWTTYVRQKHADKKRRRVERVSA